MTPVTTSVEQALVYIADDEGGVKNVGDGKGTTYWGQTLDWLNTYGLKIPTTPAEAMSNWSVWLAKTKLDQIFLTQYDEFAHTVVDYAINSGSAVAIGALQFALGVAKDGAIGPDTLGALAKFDLAGRRRLGILTVCAGIELEGIIITKHPEINAKFAEGWAFRKTRMLRRLA